MPPSGRLSAAETRAAITGSFPTSGILSASDAHFADDPEFQKTASIKIILPGWVSKPQISTILQIYALRALPPGWNSYGARPIRHDVISCVADWMLVLLKPSTPAPAVVPRVQGGLQLEWHRSGVDLEIYVDSPEQISFSTEEVASGESEEGILPRDANLLDRWISRITD
jgi:hypothetical protein